MIATSDIGPEGLRGPDRITRSRYDAAGQLLTVERAGGTNLQQNYATYSYTANGLLEGHRRQRQPRRSAL